EKLTATLERDEAAQSVEDGLLEIYKRLRPGELLTADSARSLLRSLFFDPKRYDLMRVGRYKFNKKLALAARIADHVAAEDIVSPETGEVLVQAGSAISKAKAVEIQN